MKKERMPRAGNEPEKRAVAHMRWAHRYNEANDPVRAAAHLGRAMDYQAFGTPAAAVNAAVPIVASVVAPLAGRVLGAVASVLPAWVPKWPGSTTPPTQAGPVVDFTGGFPGLKPYHGTAVSDAARKEPRVVCERGPRTFSSTLDFRDAFSSFVRRYDSRGAVDMIRSEALNGNTVAKGLLGHVGIADGLLTEGKEEEADRVMRKALGIAYESCRHGVPRGEDALNFWEGVMANKAGRKESFLKSASAKIMKGLWSEAAKELRDGITGVNKCDGDEDLDRADQLLRRLDGLQAAFLDAVNGDPVYKPSEWADFYYKLLDDPARKHFVMDGPVHRSYSAPFGIGRRVAADELANEGEARSRAEQNKRMRDAIKTFAMHGDYAAKGDRVIQVLHVDEGNTGGGELERWSREFLKGHPDVP
jgi:hypothetical protein